MFRTSVVRRLIAIIAFLAILGFTLPSTAAAAGPRSHAPRASAAQEPAFWGQLLSWIDGLLFPRPTPIPQGRTEKASTGVIPTSGGTGGFITGSSSDADHGGMIDPNG
jgi:hypothetical protein